MPGPVVSLLGVCNQTTMTAPLIEVTEPMRPPEVTDPMALPEVTEPVTLPEVTEQMTLRTQNQRH